jgi:hypothetical protein
MAVGEYGSAGMPLNSIEPPADKVVLTTAKQTLPDINLNELWGESWDFG